LRKQAGQEHGCTNKKTMNTNFQISKNGEVLCKCSTEAKGAITIPEGIVAIKQKAFKGCKTITKILFPTTLKKIGSYAFHGCDSLKSIQIPFGVEYVGKGAFKDCHRIESAVVPASLYKLAASTFENSYALKYVKIREGIQYIDDYCFKNCLSLEKIVIPNSVSFMGKAFSGCWNLTKVIMRTDRAEITKAAFEGCGEELTIACSLTIDRFFNEPTIKKIIKPKRVIKRRVLAGKVLSPHTLCFNVPNGIEVVGEEAFCDCTGLETIGISKSVMIIRARAFSGCNGLSKATFEEGVQVIGNSAFENCTSLTSLHLPDSLKEIEAHAFAGCTSLRNVSISHLTSVAATAFDANNNIKISIRQ
jgi:hypothetical protein